MDLFMVLLWGIVLIAGVIVEIVTVQFVSIWFACASLVSMIMAGLGTPRWLQLLVFAAITTILLLLTRPIVSRFRGGYVRTNADMNVGKTALVTEEIKNELSKGRATIDGVSWKAVSEDGSSIGCGEVVVIKDIDGAKLIVAKS